MIAAVAQVTVSLLVDRASSDPGSTAPPALAFTGADLRLAVIGLFLVAVGVAVVALNRTLRKAQAHA